MQLKARIDKALKDSQESASSLIKNIGMTEAGYYQMLNKDDIKLSVLKKIAVFLKKPIIYFIDDEHTVRDQVVNEPPSTYGIPFASNKENELLKSRVKDLEKIVALQERAIKQLEIKPKKQKV